MIGTRMPAQEHRCHGAYSRLDNLLKPVSQNGYPNPVFSIGQQLGVSGVRHAAVQGAVGVPSDCNLGIMLAAMR